jgi:hypothetical protein
LAYKPVQENHIKHSERISGDDKYIHVGIARERGDMKMKPIDIDFIHASNLVVCEAPLLGMTTAIILESPDHEAT